jgi:lactoylglutathione lyase
MRLSVARQRYPSEPAREDPSHHDVGAGPSVAGPLRQKEPAIRVHAPHSHRRKESPMKYMHTMIRVTDLDKSLDFFCNKLGFVDVRRYVSEKGRFTLAFLAAPEDAEAARTTYVPTVELTYNWDPEEYAGGRNFGHLAYGVDDIYETCDRLMSLGVIINRPPRDGHIAFIRTPDNISIELIQKNQDLSPREPWASMPNVGTW